MIYPLCEGSGPGAADTTLTLATASNSVKQRRDRMCFDMKRFILFPWCLVKRFICPGHRIYKFRTPSEMLGTPSWV